jgi:hypothetical protein
VLDSALPYEQAATEISSTERKEKISGIVALAGIIDTFPVAVHPNFIAGSLQAALTILGKDPEHWIKPQVLYLVGIIFQKAPSGPLGHQFLQAGGHKLLLEYLPTWPQNEALFVVLAIEEGGALLDNLKRAIVEASPPEIDSLPELCRPYLHNLDNAGILVPAILVMNLYKKLYGRIPACGIYKKPKVSRVREVHIICHCHSILYQGTCAYCISSQWARCFGMHILKAVEEVCRLFVLTVYYQWFLGKG